MLIADIPWSEIFISPFSIPLFAIVSFFGWLIVNSVSESISKVSRNRDDAELKIQLVARGFSGDEIIRIVEAGRDTEERSRRPQQVYVQERTTAT